MAGRQQTKLKGQVTTEVGRVMRVVVWNGQIVFDLRIFIHPKRCMFAGIKNTPQ